MKIIVIISCLVNNRAFTDDNNTIARNNDNDISGHHKASSHPVTEAADK